MRVVCLALLLVFTGASPPAQAREPIVGLPCEGCEAVFDGWPIKPASRARISPTSEPGQPMLVAGRVLDPSGAPRTGVVVYAYQTNSEGTYPQPVRGPASHRHGALRAWALSDAQGRYAFDTIRPASYPSRDAPEHIHMHVIERGCSTYYIDDIVFTDDPLLPAARIESRPNRGGSGVVTPVRREGVWHVARDIHLGRNVPGHTPCGALLQRRKK